MPIKYIIDFGSLRKISLIAKHPFMKDYILRLKDAANNKLDKDIPNSTVMHAEAGIRILLENSEKRVRILSTKFYADFWSKLKYEIEKFITKGGKVELLTIENPNKSSLELIKEFSDIRIDGFKHVIITKITTRPLPNLIVADKTITRFEREDSQMQDGLVSATINFNNIGRAKRFNEFIDFFSE